VEDAALLYNAMQGPDPHDPATYRQPAEDPLPQLRRGISGMRLAQLPQSERAAIDREVLAAYDESLQVLQQLGARIVDIALPQSLEAYRDATGVIIASEGYSYVGEVVERNDLPLDQHVRARMRIGATLSARDYILALRERERSKQAFAEAMDGIDALLTPGTIQAAIAVADVDENTTPAKITRVGNLLDMCGLAVPNGYTAGGLPTSLLINARGYQEALALRIGWAYEQATLAQKRLPQGLLE
jgi:aspartyl-tRNA(Asn)/glutamyl-tRNA(Gln) amidotransferase subunit A